MINETFLLDYMYYGDASLFSTNYGLLDMIGYKQVIIRKRQFSTITRINLNGLQDSAKFPQ